MAPVMWTENGESNKKGAPANLVRVGVAIVFSESAKVGTWLQYNNRTKGTAAREPGRARLEPPFGDLIAKLAFRAAQRLRRHRFVASIPKDDPSAKLRADIYYPLIVRALEQLPRNEFAARQNLYDRAIAMLTSKLHGQDHSLVAHERRALEMAIRRAEIQASVREIISQKYSVGGWMETTPRHTTG